MTDAGAQARRLLDDAREYLSLAETELLGELRGAVVRIREHAGNELVRTGTAQELGRLADYVEAAVQRIDAVRSKGAG